MVALCGAVAGLVAVTGFFRTVPKTLTATAIATLLALALNPLVVGVQRRLVVRRAVAVAVVLGGLFTLFALVLTLLFPAAVRQGGRLGDDLPQVVADLGRLPIVGERLRRGDVPARIDAAIRDLPGRLSGDTTPLEQAGRSVFDGLVAAFTTMLLAAALAGLVNLTAGLILGVPLAPLAAVNVMLWNLVPQIGGLFGGLPFVVLGFTKSPATGVACAAVFLIYMNIENRLIQPLLIGNAVKLSPPATMTAALIGVSAGGVVGAMMVIPLVGAAKAIYTEVRRDGEGGLSPPGPGGPAVPDG